MITKNQKPFSVTTKDGKTTFFSSGSEIYLWARRNKPEWIVDCDKGIDYDNWAGDGSCTREELEKCYENTGVFQKNKKKKVEEVKS